MTQSLGSLSPVASSLQRSEQARSLKSQQSYERELASLLEDDDDAATAAIPPNSVEIQQQQPDETVTTSGISPSASDTEETFVYPSSRLGDQRDEDDEFVYPHSDNSFSVDGSDDQQDGDASPRSYNAKMQSIVGSSDEEVRNDDHDKGLDNNQVQEADPLDPDSFQQQDGWSQQGYEEPSQGDEDDASLLPDRTLDSMPDLSAPSRGFKWRRVPSMTSTNTGDDSFDRTVPSSRPPEYPLLSRLRSHDLRRNASESLHRTRLGSLGGLPRVASSASQRPQFSASPSIQSKNTSLSGSLTTGRRRLFPYGSSALSAHSESNEASATASTSVEGNNGEDAQAISAPLRSVDEGIFRWSALRRTAAFFQNSGRRTTQGTVPALSGQILPQLIGEQSVIAVADGLIAVGTTEGITLVFGFSQEPRCICGIGENARSGGPVTSLSFSADGSFLAVGHAIGLIEIYDLSRPAHPARQVPTTSLAEVTSGRREGHLFGSKILHVAFVGTRHTAIFSADDRGLAFYHSLGKILGVASNDTLKILGRYPEAAENSNGEALPRNGRRSAILAMTALPLGPIDHPADAIHFVALITSRKLVVVGLKPSARTWFRKSAPLEPPTESTTSNSYTNGHSASSDSASPHVLPASSHAVANLTDSPVPPSTSGACASWFPAYQAETPSSCTNPAGFVEPSLVFAFGCSLFRLQMVTKRRRIRPDHVNLDDAAIESNGYRTEITFSEQSLCQADEAIEAIEWLSHELLLLVTPSRAELFDLRRKGVIKTTPLYPTLAGLIRHPLAQRLNDSQGRKATFLTGQSVRAYQGKVFFLTASQIVVGHLLSWTDRLLSLVSSGDFLTAIDMCTAFYRGRVPGSAIGLPEDKVQMQEQVALKLRELMSASARYAFSPERLVDNTHVTPDGRGVDRTDLFGKLASTSAEACLALEDTSYLFGQLYDFYADSGIESIFVDQMEPFVLSGRLRHLPIPVTQKLISACSSNQNFELAEKIIWHVDPLCLDLDQVLSLCTDRRLWDALIFVYNSALQDFVSPVIELLQLLKSLLDDSRTDVGDAEELRETKSDVYKIFSYLSVILCGHSFPEQEPLTQGNATKAKSSLYSFLFAGHCIVWPPNGGGRLVLSVADGLEEPTYPYLRLLLRFDAEAFLDALDIAFEDAYLDDMGEPQDQAQVFSRQRIIEILLEVWEDEDNPLCLSDAARTFITIFIARNVPKYPQFISLSANTIDTLLSALCCSNLVGTREDRQLAAEYLLSQSGKIQFGDDELAMLEHAGFWRILQSAYRFAGKWGQLTAMYLNDPSSDSAIFAQLSEVLNKARAQNNRSDLDSIILEAVKHLMDIDVTECVTLIDRFFPDKHPDALQSMEGDDCEERQLSYLRVLLDPPQLWSTDHPADNSIGGDIKLRAEHLDVGSRELYVSLKSQREGDDLVRGLSNQAEGYFNLEHVAESARRDGVLDALLWALDKQGQSQQQLFDALNEVIYAQIHSLTNQDLGEPLNRIRKALEMAVRICRRRCDALQSRALSEPSQTEDVWFGLLRTLVNLLHETADSKQRASSDEDSQAAFNLATDIVQETFAAMLTSMSADSVAFPTLFRRLVEARDTQSHGITEASRVTYYADVRTVVTSMIQACKVQSDLHSIAYRLFDRDTSANFRELIRRQKRGWRPASYQSSNRHRSSDAKASGNTPSGPRTPASASIASTPMRRGPSRGIDFLATTPTATATSLSPSFAVQQQQQQQLHSQQLYEDGRSHSGYSSPALDPKGKGKAREENIFRSHDGSSRSVNEEGGGVGDYFSSHINSAQEDPLDVFTGSTLPVAPATPRSSIARDLQIPMSSTLAQDNPEQHDGEDWDQTQRHPVVVRLGAVH